MQGPSRSTHPCRPANILSRSECSNLISYTRIHYTLDRALTSLTNNISASYLHHNPKEEKKKTNKASTCPLKEYDTTMMSKRQ